MNTLWFKNPTILLKNMDQFFPLQKYNLIQKVNSIARLGFYLLIYALLYNSQFIKFSIILIAISYFMSNKKLEKMANIKDINEHNSKKYKKVENKNCIKPTKKNPFMNFTVGSHIEDPKREEACDNDDKKINERVTEMFDNKYLYDSYDLFNRKSNERQFVTMPTTQSFSNQDKFRDALYGGFGKCKSEGIDCAKKLDTRHNFRYDQSY